MDVEREREAWRQRNPGVELPDAEIDALVELERLAGAAIPKVETVEWKTFGYDVAGGHVAGLGLYKVGMSYIPGTIGNLVNLKELYLIWNQLSSLPGTIGNLTALTSLDLYGNSLQSLPDNIGNLKALETLWLNTNQLSSLPGRIKDWIEDLKKRGCTGIQ